MAWLGDVPDHPDLTPDQMRRCLAFAIADQERHVQNAVLFIEQRDDARRALALATAEIARLHALLDQTPRAILSKTDGVLEGWVPTFQDVPGDGPGWVVNADGCTVKMEVT